MSSGVIDRVLDRVDGDAVVEFLRRSVQTPSITGEEGPVAELVAEEFRSSGLDQVEVFDFLPARPNVWGLIKGKLMRSRPLAPFSRRVGSRSHRAG